MRGVNRDCRGCLIDTDTGRYNSILVYKPHGRVSAVGFFFWMDVEVNVVWKPPAV